MTADNGRRCHGTTILAVRNGERVVVAGHGQVTLGNTVIKSNARKVRRLADCGLIAGFADATGGPPKKAKRMTVAQSHDVLVAE